MWPPVNFTKAIAQIYKILQAGTDHFFFNVLKGIQKANPTAFILNIIVPFFVITVIGAMKIQHIFTNKKKPVDAITHHVIDDFPFEVHDIVVQAIVPFADEFNDGKPFIIIGKEYFQVKRCRAKFIPLGVNKVVVDLISEVKLAVLPAVKRRELVFGGDILVAPLVEWFDIVHNQAVNLQITCKIKECSMLLRKCYCMRSKRESKSTCSVISSIALLTFHGVAVLIFTSILLIFTTEP